MMGCNDCGGGLTQETMTRRRGRTDVCDRCLETRMQLVSGNLIPCGSPEFKILQRKMARGRGTAKRYLDSLLSGGHGLGHEGGVHD